MPKKSPFSQMPKVSAKKIAGTNPVGTVVVGSGKPGIVPPGTKYSRAITPKNEPTPLKARGFSSKLKHRKAGHK